MDKEEHLKVPSQTWATRISMFSLQDNESSKACCRSGGHVANFDPVLHQPFFRLPFGNMAGTSSVPSGHNYVHLRSFLF